jgi:hypothetical protein
VAQGLNVGQSSIDAAEAEMRGNFAERGSEAVRVLFALNEAEDLLLSFGKCLNTEQMSSSWQWLSRRDALLKAINGMRKAKGATLASLRNPWVS